MELQARLRERRLGGGEDIFTELLNKYIALSPTALVYGWQDTEQAIDYRVDNFLTVDDNTVFTKRYQKERDMQYKAFKEDVDKEESSMFVHELE